MTSALSCPQQAGWALRGDRTHPATPTLAMLGSLSLMLGTGQGLALGTAKP